MTSWRLSELVSSQEDCEAVLLVIYCNLKIFQINNPTFLSINDIYDE